MHPLLRTLALTFVFGAASAETCRVVGVQDGDTLTCLTAAQQQIRVRLAEIDAPESAQPWGARSKQALSDICFGKDATLAVQDTDRYGRTVARVDCAGLDANAEQVRAGMAWAYRQYLRDQSLLGLEADAKAARRGLWTDAAPVPPWDWRRGQRGDATTDAGGEPRPTPKPAAGGFTCAGKTVCREMSSCAEARFYLEHCGVSRLDRDHDGVPCESICR